MNLKWHLFNQNQDKLLLIGLNSNGIIIRRFKSGGYLAFLMKEFIKSKLKISLLF